MDIYKFWKAVLVQDENELIKYFHEDARVNWHCTNECFTVKEYIIANCEYPGDWDGEIERIETANDLYITDTFHFGIINFYFVSSKVFVIIAFVVVIAVTFAS